jgi:hypothetical protein
MKTDEDLIKELQLENERLQHEANKYRKATEDSMQQLGWCIGYFAGSNKPRIAQGLSANFAHIRQDILDQQDVAMPTKQE